MELAQPYDAFKPFALITSGSIAETVLTVSSFMTEANKITLIVDKADLYINFNGTATTDAIFVLKDIPIPQGSTFVWDDDNILSDAFKSGSSVSRYQDTRGIFTPLKNNTFLIRAGSGHTVEDLLTRR